MRQFLPVLILMLAIVCIANGQNQEKVYEHANVNLIKIQVRVFNQGQAVTGLKAEDFSMLENGVPKAITLCEEKRAARKPEEIRADYRDPRLYALIFNVSSSGPEIEKALQYIYSAAVRPGDHVMIMARTFLIKDHAITDPAADLANLLQTLNAKAQITRGKNIELQSKMQVASEVFQEEASASAGTRAGNASIDTLAAIDVYQNMYRQYQTEYAGNFLQNRATPPQEYAKLAIYMQHRSIDTAVIVFNQLIYLPDIGNSGDLYQSLQDPGHAEMNFVGAQQFDDAIQADSAHKSILVMPQKCLEIFSSKNTVRTHGLLVSPMERSGMGIMKIYGRDTEEVVQQLCQRTGGVVAKGASPEPLYAALCNTQDIWYDVYYAPTANKDNKKNVISIRSLKKDYAVVLDDKEKQQYLRFFAEQNRRAHNYLAIENMTVSDENRLEFTLANYMRQEVDSALKGDIVLRLRIKDENKKIVLDKEAKANPENETEQFSFGLPDSLAAGKYTLALDIIDLLQKKTINSGMEFTLNK